MKKMILMACTAALIASAHAVPFEHAKLSIDKHNIKVWTYQNSQNPVLQYQAETIYDCSLEKAVALILDVDQAVKWVPYMGRVKVLSSDSQKGESLSLERKTSGFSPEKHRFARSATGVSH